MKRTLSDSTLLALSEFIAQKLGLYFPVSRWNELESKINCAAKTSHYQDTNEYIAQVVSNSINQKDVEELTSCLTINETYFWRDSKSFDILENKILPELIKRRSKEKIIKIWSAGCSTGEEPYSIAIALIRMIPDVANWSISILATDIDVDALELAKKGEYREWSFRSSPPWFKDIYFKSVGDKRFSVNPEIKKMVSFKQHNLTEKISLEAESYTKFCDVIFCRNVIMYFTSETAKKTIKRLYNSLVTEGYLVVGASELCFQNFTNFESVNYDGAICYRKHRKRKIAENKPLITVGISDTPISKPIKNKVSSEIDSGSSNSYTQTEVELDNKQIQKLYKKGRYNDLIATLEARTDKSEYFQLLARSYANLGRFSDAQRVSEQAVALDKMNPSNYYFNALILQEQNKLDEAIESLKRVLYLKNDFVLAYYVLGSIYLKKEAFELARKNYLNVKALLSTLNKEDVLPNSDGLTVGRFKEVIESILIKTIQV